MTVSCAGKIFIIGEYTCLAGNQAIVSALKPRYKLQPGTLPINFHPHSPARKLWLQYQNANLDKSDLNLQKLTLPKLNFVDPMDITMGFGSSSAQFLLSWNWIERTLAPTSTYKPHSVETEMASAVKLLKDYWEVTADDGTATLRPSGLDLLTQYFGGTNLLTATQVVSADGPSENPSISRAKLPAWENDKSILILAHSRKKEATHIHLQELKLKGFPDSHLEMISKLNDSVTRALGAWKKSDSKDLGQAFNEFQSTLNKYKVASLEFSKLVRHISEITGVYGAKGSGAQGGDCILLLVEKSKLSGISKSIESLGCTVFIPEWDDQGLLLAE